MVKGRSASSGDFGWPLARFSGLRLLLVMLLVLACLGSALAVITTSHLTRVQYADLQRLQSEHQQLQTEWGQLLLEDSAWSSPARVEGLAEERLEMRLPDVADVEVIRP